MKKILTVLLCAVLMMGFTACAQQAAESPQAATGEQADVQAADGAMYGQVTAISGNDATIILGTMTEGMGGPPGMENGEAPTGGAQDGEIPPDMQGGGTPPNDIQDGEAPEPPSGENPPGDAQGGGTPPDMGGGGPGGIGGFTADEDGTEITVDLAAVTITKQDGDSEAEVSASDLTEGTVVKMEGPGEGASFVPEALVIVNAGGGPVPA